jgi:hypothetical protein
LNSLIFQNLPAVSQEPFFFFAKKSFFDMLLCLTAPSAEVVGGANADSRWQEAKQPLTGRLRKTFSLLCSRDRRDQAHRHGQYKNEQLLKVNVFGSK